MMFITWVQDEMEHLLNAEAGAKTSSYAQKHRRDLLVGYANPNLSTLYGYPRDRLVQTHIPADSNRFSPMVLSSVDRSKYSCEVAFVSHVSRPSEEIAEQLLLPYATERGLPRDTVYQIHDHLWKDYRAGRCFTDRMSFINMLSSFPDFDSFYKNLNSRDQLQTQILFYWRLNDTIYRHVVLEWAVEKGVDLHIYGRGWDKHPTFERYAKGVVQHGHELTKVYQAAKLNLHLNVTQGMHQRVWEILSSGATPLFRSSHAKPLQPLDIVMRYLAQAMYNRYLTEKDLNALLDSEHERGAADSLHTFFFQEALKRASSEDRLDRSSDRCDHMVSDILFGIRRLLHTNASWWFVDWEEISFSDKEMFNKKTSHLVNSRHPHAPVSVAHRGITLGNNYSQLRNDILYYVSTLLGEKNLHIPLGEPSKTRQNIWKKLTPLCNLATELVEIQQGQYKTKRHTAATLMDTFGRIDSPTTRMKIHVAKALAQNLQGGQDLDPILRSLDESQIVEEHELMEYLDLLVSIGETNKAIQQCEEAYKENARLLNGFSRIGWRAYLRLQPCSPLALFAKDKRLERQSDPWRLKHTWLCIEANRFAEAKSVFAEIKPTNLSCDRDHITYIFLKTILTKDSREAFSSDPALNRATYKEVLNALCSFTQMTLLRCTNRDKTALDSRILDTLVYFLLPTLPQNPAACQAATDIARLLISSGRYEESLEVVRRTCRDKASMRKSSIVLTINLCLNNQYELAERLLGDVDDAGFAEPIHRFRYAVAHGLLGHRIQAKQSLQHLRQKAPDFFLQSEHPTKWFTYALMLKALAYEEDCRTHLQCAREFDPSLPYREHWLDTIRIYPSKGHAEQLPTFRCPTKKIPPRESQQAFT